MTLTRKESSGSGSGKDPRVRPATPFRVLSFDPGGSSGVATAVWRPTTSDVKLTELNQIEFNCWHLEGEHHIHLFAVLETQYQMAQEESVPLEIVCESFLFRQHINPNAAKTKVELFSVEYIGIIKLFCQIYNLQLTLNTASAAKTLVPDKGPQANKKIKQLGWYLPGMIHGMDATRHLLRYLVVNKRIRSPITDYWL